MTTSERPTSGTGTDAEESVQEVPRYFIDKGKFYGDPEYSVDKLLAALAKEGFSFAATIVPKTIKQLYDADPSKFDAYWLNYDPSRSMAPFADERQFQEDRLPERGILAVNPDLFIGPIGARAKTLVPERIIDSGATTKAVRPLQETLRAATGFNRLVVRVPTDSEIAQIDFAYQEATHSPLIREKFVTTEQHCMEGLVRALGRAWNSGPLKFGPAHMDWMNSEHSAKFRDTRSLRFYAMPVVVVA